MEYILYIFLFSIVMFLLYRRHSVLFNYTRNKHNERIRREAFILEYLSYNNEISTEEVKDMFHVSEKTALEYLHNLETVGRIKPVRKERNRIIYSLK